jgi:nucleoside-diphosphate-sugar epimerase
MNVVIIGGSGFLGSAIAEACARAGADVTVLSRHVRAGQGESVRADVRLPGLGLSAADAARLRERTTHAVLCFGAVSWTCGPGAALETHSVGTRNALALLRQLPGLQQAVHISSLLALGRAQGTITNRELYTGQQFRNWYEYGKYCAERQVRDAADLPVSVLRLGPVLGPDPRGGQPDTGSGLPSVFPHLLAGYPVHLERRGDFPCWVTDARSAAAVVLKALRAPAGRAVWTWFDPAMPTLARVFGEVCRPWGVVPRILDAGLLGRLTRLAGDRAGVPPEVLAYARPWFDLDPNILTDIPAPWPETDPDYLAATGRALLGPAHAITQVSR